MLNITAHGRIGADCELRYTQDGTAVTEIALACNYGRKDQDGNRPTQWVRASLWGKQAEALTEFLTKGKGLVLTLEDGHIREYETKSGAKGAALEGRVIGLEFTGAGPREEGEPRQQARQEARPPQRQPQRQAQHSSRPATGFDNMDDDIPF